jgi:catechol 2,3-dioxygenase-like lactoylglutathione lyase family enzyme
MAIIGIESVLYGVNDVAECTRYFTDFGLPLADKSETHARFRLEEGSSIIIRHISDPAIPSSSLSGIGVCETVWGVDTQESLSALIANLQRDRPVKIDTDGTAHCLTDEGQAIGLRLYRKNPVVSAPDPVNSPGRVNRLNTHRKWRVKALPKTILHVVFQSPDFEKAWTFYRDRIGFRLSDIQKTFGVFARADGAHDHHNIYFLNSNLPFPGFDGKLRFDHVNFGVEDIDEVMVGANHMQRQGWPQSVWGLGRHRIASSIFMYLPCPAGGQAEYGTDSDMLDDNWIPRVWHPMFGFFSFITNIPPFMADAAPWEVTYAEGYLPAKAPAGTSPPRPDQVPAHAPSAHAEPPLPVPAE